MKAIVIAARDLENDQPVMRNDLSCFLPLMDRPFIQHVIEHLAGQGIRKFDFIISSFPERIRSFLGDGSRWGVQIHCELVRDPLRPYERMRVLLSDLPLLLIHADRLVWVDIHSDRMKLPLDCTCLYMTSPPDSNSTGKWTGWGWISSTDCQAIPDGLNEEEIFQWLSNRSMVRFLTVQREMLSVQTFSAMLQAHWQVLDSEFSGLLVSGTQIEPGVWLSRNVILHPLSRIVPPVFVGQNSQILKGVQLGPYAVIGDNCIVDNRCMIATSVIRSGSYVGQSLEITDAVVDKNCLINTRLDSTLSLSENFLLGPLARDKRMRLNVFNHLFAGIMLSCLWPLMLITVSCLALFRNGPVVFTKKCIRLPADPTHGPMKLFMLRSFCPLAHSHSPFVPSTDTFHKTLFTPRVDLRDFFLRFMPGLFSVVAGRLRLVGLPPRSLFEIEAMPADWRILYVQGQAGLIYETMVAFGAEATMDECQASEMIYAATSNWRVDLKLFFQYFGQILGLYPRAESD